MERDLAEYAQRVLVNRGVKLHLSSPARRIDPGRVHLPDGSAIEAHTLVLSAGVASNPLLATLPLEKDRKGRVLVDGTMRSRSHPNVWGIGDCAVIPDPTGKPYPQLAQHALREARVLAANITSAIGGGSTTPFAYQTLGTLASLGDYQGVGRVMKVKLRGILAWWAWRSYYLFQMPRLERKLRIVLDWTVALFFPHDIVKLDLFGDQHPTRRREPASSPPGASQPDPPLAA
jgi:NADH dehydrogenase